MSDIRDKLARMTVANGASPNEEAIARNKMAKYANFIKKETPKKSFHIQEENDIMPLHEHQFRQEWYKLKMENRRKWGA